MPKLTNVKCDCHGRAHPRQLKTTPLSCHDCRTSLSIYFEAKKNIRRYTSSEDCSSSSESCLKGNTTFGINKQQNKARRLPIIF